MKKVWKDKHGAVTPLTAILVIVLIVVLVGIAYLAMAADSEQNDNQDRDSKDDEIIGRMQIAVKVKILNPDYELFKDDDVVYTIDKVEATLIAVEPASFLDIFDGLELWSGDDNLKLTCKLVYDQSPQVLINPSSPGGIVEWNQEYKGTATSIGDVISYHSESFYSGSLYYHGNYYLEIKLYKDVSGSWEQVDMEKMSVTI